MRKLPGHTCDALHKGLRAALTGYGLQSINLVGVNPMLSYQHGLEAIITVETNACRRALLDTSILVLDTLVCLSLPPSDSMCFWQASFTAQQSCMLSRVKARHASLTLHTAD